MPTRAEIQAQAARRTRRAVSAAIGLAALMAAAAAWLAFSGPGSAGRASTDVPPDPTTTPAAGTAGPGPRVTASIPPGPAAAGAYVAPARWLRLPAPGRLEGEWPAGWPHTPLGAAALVVAAATRGWSADPAVMAAAARRYTVPERAASSAAVAPAAAASLRRVFELPPTGPLPEGVALSARVVGVQWRVLSADRVRVSVLAEVTGHGRGQQLPTLLYATTGDVVWRVDLADWRSLPSPGPLPTPRLAQVGTAAFNEAGWAALTPGAGVGGGGE
jgi:hypothetical protein